jgi:hydrocephalus-inducing protein
MMSTLFVFLDHCCVQVAFRPAVRQTYADCLELQCGTATIAVPLEALLPASKLQLPPALYFGCVPAKEQVQQQLPIKNVGDAQLRFAWKIEAPFAILPAAGQLAPGQTLLCQVCL